MSTYNDIEQVDTDTLVDFSLKDTYDFTHATKINKHALEDECQMQAELMRDFSHLAAVIEAKSNYYKRKAELKRAELDKDIRQNPKNYGMDKVTESAITNTIILDPEIKTLQDEYWKNVGQHGVVMAVVKGLEHKRTQLDNLVKLFLNNYYAEPRTTDKMKTASVYMAGDAINDTLTKDSKYDSLRKRRVTE